MWWRASENEYASGEPEYFNGSKLEVRYVAFRLDEAPVDDVRVRKALAMSIQRTEIPNALKGGELPTKSWLPPGMFGYDATIGHGYDPDAARALLADAGYPDGSGFPPTTLLFRAGDDWKLAAENLQQQWKRELGIDITIETREQKAFFGEIDGEAPPPAHLARWVADFPDPENFMSLFKSNSGNNSLGFGSGRYDELVGMFMKEEVPACGFSLGVERILLLMEERGLFDDERADIDVLVTMWNAEFAPQTL